MKGPAAQTAGEAAAGAGLGLGEVVWVQLPFSASLAAATFRPLPMFPSMERLRGPSSACKPLEGHTPPTALCAMDLEGVRNSLRRSRPAVIPPTTCAATTSAENISARGTAFPALRRTYDVRRPPGKKWVWRAAWGRGQRDGCILAKFAENVARCGDFPCGGAAAPAAEPLGFCGTSNIVKET